MGDLIPKAETIRDTDWRCDEFRQDGIPNEVDLGSLQSGSDMYLKERLRSGQWMTHSLDCKRVDLQHGCAHYHSPQSPARRERRSPCNTVKRATNEVPRHSNVEHGQRCSNDSGVWLPENSDVSLETAMSHGFLNRTQVAVRKPGAANRLSRPSSPNDEKKLSHEEFRYVHRAE